MEEAKKSDRNCGETWVNGRAFNVVCVKVCSPTDISPNQQVLRGFKTEFLSTRSVSSKTC